MNVRVALERYYGANTGSLSISGAYVTDKKSPGKAGAR
jgi:hypothetical protein